MVVSSGCTIFVVTKAAKMKAPKTINFTTPCPTVHCEDVPAGCFVCEEEVLLALIDGY